MMPFSLVSMHAVRPVALQLNSLHHIEVSVHIGCQDVASWVLRSVAKHAQEVIQLLTLWNLVLSTK